MSFPSPDRFGLPSAAGENTPCNGGAARSQGATEAQPFIGNDEIGEHPRTPGRGWGPLSRDLGIPSEHGVADPVAALGRRTVFTLERRVRFLDHLAFNGNARAAAALVNVSHETAYRARRRDAAFAALWDAALVHARSYGEQVLATRALDGVEVAVWYHGELVGHDVRHDPRFLFAHLARLDRHVEADPGAVARAGRFDELLARYAGQPVPEGFAEAVDEARGPWPDPAAPRDLPPTRAEYLAYHRGLAMDLLEVEEGTDREARLEAEAELAEELCEEAAETWDAWHHGSLARVGAIVAPGEHDAEGQDEGEGRPHTPLPLAGGAGGGPVPPHDFRDPPSPDPGQPEEGEPDPMPRDPPYEIKSMPAFHCVTPVNPGPENRPETSMVETTGAIAHSALVTRVTNEGEKETMSTFLNRFPLKAATAALGALALAAPAAAQFGGPPAPPNTGVPFSANLTSWAEVPGPGNGQGSGRVTVVVDPPKGQLCYMFFDVYGIGTPTAAHVHVGAAGAAGNPVATLQPPVGGSSSGCQPIAADLAQAIVSNPAGYYVNVHTAEFPNGALRGQLSG